MQDNNEALIDLIKDHELRLQKEYVLHHYECDDLNNTEKRLGILLIIMNSLATGTFLQLFTTTIPPVWLTQVSVICSIVAAILAYLVVFMDYKSRAQLHHNAATNFGHLLNQCRASLVDPQIKNLSSRARAEEIERHLEERMEEGPLSLRETTELIEELGGIRPSRILEHLGYTIEWRGISPEMATVHRGK